MKEKPPIYAKKTEQDVKYELSVILSAIADCKMRGVAPPIGLIGDAFALAALYPFGDVLKELLKITNMAFEAAQEAVKNGLSPDSWLASLERKKFDELVARDPVRAMAEYFQNPQVKADRETLNDIIAGRFVSTERSVELAVNILSEEDQYKRTAFIATVPIVIERLKQQGQNKARKIVEDDL